MIKNYTGSDADRVQGGPAYRIDATSNYGSDTYAESVKLTFLTESQAKRIADILNETCGDGPTYYQPRTHGSALWRGMEDLV